MTEDIDINKIVDHWMTDSDKDYETMIHLFQTYGPFIRNQWINLCVLIIIGGLVYCCTISILLRQKIGKLIAFIQKEINKRHSTTATMGNLTEKGNL